LLLLNGVTILFELGSSTGGKGTFSSAEYIGNGEYEPTFTATSVGSNTVAVFMNNSKVTLNAPIKVIAAT
jgi:hypothetical protein